MLANIHFYISLKLPLLSFSAAAKSELTCVVLKPNERILILILILIPYVFQTFLTLIYWLS